VTRRSGPLEIMMLLTALASIASYPERARAQEPPPPSLELEQRGHRKKVIGAVLMGVGIGLSAVGIGLALDGAMHAECSGHEEHAVCKPSFATSELDAGTTSLLFGQVLTIVGIPVYIVGGRQVATARRLSGQLAFVPLAGAAGSGAVAQASLRF
jgi:hypothetical protein